MERDRTEDGIDVLTKLHGDHNPDSAVVKLEITEIKESIAHAVAIKDAQWWDLRPLFRTQGGRHRVWIIFLFGFFNQFTGGGVIS